MGNALATAPRRPKLLKPEEAAEYLGIAHWKLYELARNGVLASIKVHRTIRFDPLDLDAFIESYRRPVLATRRQTWKPKGKRQERPKQDRQRNHGNG
jgi:excisionase family DNA binding protein